MKYLFLVLLWVSYCAFHSGLITKTVTSFLKQAIGSNFRYYRIFYNSFAVITLIPVVLYTYSIRQSPFFSWEGYLLPIRYILLVMGLIILYAGSRHYDMLTFIGLRQVTRDVTHNLINKSGKIDSTGILGVVRHPFYSGSFLLLWANNLDISMLIVNIILSSYLIIGTLLEEKKLVQEFGNEYMEYQKRVSMLFPVKWIYQRVQSVKISV